MPITENYSLLLLLSMPDIFRCCMCDVHKFSLSKLVSHVGLLHQHEAGFQVICRLNACQHIIKTFDVYKKHVYRKHRSLLVDAATTDHGESFDTTVDDAIDAFDDDDVDASCDEQKKMSVLMSCYKV